MKIQDGVRDLLGAIAIYLLCTGIYHWQLGTDGRALSPAKSRAKNPGAVAFDYWDTISPLDLRYGSHVIWVPRFILGAYRFAALGYCFAMWVIYLKSKRCCSDFVYFQVWNFVLLTLLFGSGIFVSLLSPLPDGKLRSIGKFFIILLEIEVPTVMFCYLLHVQVFSQEAEVMFPSQNSTSLNWAFASTNLGLVLVELLLNRIVLNYRRWMYISYLGLTYLVFLIAVQLISGELVYRQANFLPLEADSFPKIVLTLMAYLCFHYVGCMLVSIRQTLWTLPITHPIQGAVAQETTYSSNTTPLLDSRVGEGEVGALETSDPSLPGSTPSSQPTDPLSQ
mmetsp:Transcript_6273/g.11162  ORF Transcript_6273/g.11162 Transcript_6273/m.11162 type:complete len:336 (+) Transcript_6273:229-1236(+)